MLKMNVPDMTCGHCAGMVTKAVQSVDSAARINPRAETSADAAKVAQALDTAGYPAQAV